MAESTIVCPSCKKSFSSSRYFKSHLKYLSNEKCKSVWQKRVVPEEPPRISPQKRASDADSDDGITKEPRTDIFTRQNEYVAGAVQHYFPSTSPSQSDEQSSVNYTENVEENEDMPTFGNESDDEQQSTPSPNTEIRDKFKEYCHSAYRNTPWPAGSQQRKSHLIKTDYLGKQTVGS